MADIVRWDPYREVARMTRMMDRMFGEMPQLWRGEFDGGEGTFALDLYETDNEIVIRGTLPGVKPEDVDITISGDLLTIKGETKRDEEKRRRNYYRQESWYGSFVRAITLPTQVDADKAEATFEDGILKLTIPKAASARPKTITVKPAKMVEGEHMTSSEGRSGGQKR
ncbi:MAG: Hsp20/alpha crystallin family protein [Dehalococcoidia bacterium]